MKRLAILIILFTTSIVKAEMLNQEQTVIKAITAAQENDLENFIKYVRLTDVYANNGKDFPPYKLVRFLNNIDLNKTTTELQKKNIVVIDDSKQRIEFTVRYFDNPSIRDEKQYVVSRVRIIE